MADLLTVDALVAPFGLTELDLLHWAVPLPPDLRERATFWMAVYLCWIKRVGQRSMLGDPLVEVRSDMGAPFADNDSVALEEWFRTLDDATRSARAEAKGTGAQMESFAARALLVHDSASPYHGTNTPPDGLDDTLGKLLRRSKDFALPAIDSGVDTLGRPMPLVWNGDPGPVERRLRRRHGNLLFPPRQRIVEQWEIDDARETDEAALRSHDWKLRLERQRQLDVADVKSLEHCYRTIDNYDELVIAFLWHGTAKAIASAAEITVASAELAGRVRELLADDPRLRYFNERREAFRERDARFCHVAYTEFWDMRPNEVVSTLCSFAPEEIAFVLHTAIKLHYPSREDLRSACATRFAEAIQEGFPAEIAAARLRAMERLPGFPPGLRQRANLWIALYVFWSYRDILRNIVGDAFVEPASAIALRLRADGLGNRADAIAALEWWFHTLDNAFNAAHDTARRGNTVFPPCWQARAFLAGDIDSPYYGASDIPESAESVLDEALDEARNAADPFINSSLGIPARPGEASASDTPNVAASHGSTAAEILERGLNDRELIQALLHGLRARS